MADGPAEVIRLWRSAARVERSSIEASGWRAWPASGVAIFRCTVDRSYASETARERHVPREGVGYVMSFGVRNGFLDRYELHEVDGRGAMEYRIPDDDLGDLNTNLVGAIEEMAEYRGPVADAAFATASRRFRAELPHAWRAYLQGRAWFRRGWLTDACFVWLYTPDESVELTRAWEPSTPHHPGIAVIGGDGAREQLALDLRRASPPVVAVQIVSAGWDEAVEQAASLESFIERVEDGSFQFRRE